jgi:hypothetical protein
MLYVVPVTVVGPIMEHGAEVREQTLNVHVVPDGIIFALFPTLAATNEPALFSNPENDVGARPPEM